MRRGLAGERRSERRASDERDGSVERSSAERNALTDIGKEEIALDFAFQSNLCRRKGQGQRFGLRLCAEKSSELFPHSLASPKPGPTAEKLSTHRACHPRHPYQPIRGPLPSRSRPKVLTLLRHRASKPAVRYPRPLLMVVCRIRGSACAQCSANGSTNRSSSSRQR